MVNTTDINEARMGRSLEPCPCCGAEAKIFADQYSGFTVKCGGCGLSLNKTDTVYAVVEAWNTRIAEEENELDDHIFLEIGDEVQVNINAAHLTLVVKGELHHMPQGTGDSWIIEDMISGKVHYISEPRTISKAIKKGENHEW